MKIAFFDSGIGGLTVLHEARKQMPREDYLYYADTAHVPYGTKSISEIQRFVGEAVAFIAAQNVKALVVACNTATSVAISALREQYSFPIIGMEPAVKPAVQTSCVGQRVLVTATPVTLREKKLQNLLERIDLQHQADLLPLPKLVELAEQERFEGIEAEEYLQQMLAPYHWEEYSSLVLGCTHFRYFSDSFRKLLPPHVALIDGSVGTVRNLQQHLAERHQLEGGSGKIEYYVSGRTDAANHEKYERLLARLDWLEAAEVKENMQ